MKNDYEIYGYEALFPNKKLAIQSTSNQLELLIQSNIKLQEEINKLIREENRKGKPTIKYVHERFLKICLKHGVKQYQYPFTLKDCGYRQFVRYINKLEQEKKKLKAQNLRELPLNQRLLQPLEQVEIDGHRIDAYFVTEITLPSGTTRKIIIERPWVLCAIDRSTRCILGYHLATTTEYNSNDVISCIENSLIPKHKDLSLVAIQKLSSKGGFLNRIVPNVEFAVMSELYLDNAMSHLSNITLNLLVDRMGIALTFGKVAEPTRRGIIERFFQTLEESSFHQIKSTTGSHKDDLRRKDPEIKAVQYNISINDLKDLLEVTIHNYNGTPHSALFGNSPLEDFKQKNNGLLYGYLPLELRSEEVFHQEVEIRKVNSNDKKNNSYLHINYLGAKYTSPLLSSNKSMINKELVLHINTLDLRKIKAFQLDGSFFGILNVERKWQSKQHSKKERIEINKLVKEKAFALDDRRDMLELYDHHIASLAPISKKEASKVAKRQLQGEEVSLLANKSEKRTEPTRNLRSEPVKFRPINL